MSKIRPVSKTGVSRKGASAGSVVRLKADCKAYASAVASSHAQYYDIEVRELREAFPIIRADGPVLHEDANNRTYIREAESSALPTFHNVPEVTKS